MVVTLFGKRQMIEFTALARPRCSGATIPMRNESPIGADMFIKAARTMYRPAAAKALVTKARLNMKTVERPWAMTMARTGPYRFAREALTVAARPIVTLDRARSGPLQVSGTWNFRKSHVGTRGMKKPAPRPMRPLMPENLRSGFQSIPFGRVSRVRSVSWTFRRRRYNAIGMTKPRPSVTTSAATWIVWVSIPVRPWRNGNDKGSANPIPEKTLFRTNERANAAPRCSAVVWSAMIAFHDDRKAPSPTPAMTAARTSHRTSVVKANTRIDGGRIALPTSRRPFRPRRSEYTPSGAALTTIAIPRAPRISPTTWVETPISGKYAVMKTVM